MKDNKPEFCSFTGLPSYATFKALLEYIKPNTEDMIWWRGSKIQARRGRRSRRSDRMYSRKLPLEDQFFIVLVRLRTGMNLSNLARAFSVNQSWLSLMFTTWINLLSCELEDLTLYVNNDYALHGAEAFRQFPRTRFVIDCTEVFCERPSSLAARKQLFSNYKHHTTVKFLVGISPNGGVSISCLKHGVEEPVTRKSPKAPTVCICSNPVRY